MSWGCDVPNRKWHTFGVRGGARTVVERQRSLHGRTNRKMWRPITVKRAYKNIVAEERHGLRAKWTPLARALEYERAK